MYIHTCIHTDQSCITAFPARGGGGEEKKKGGGAEGLGDGGLSRESSLSERIFLGREGVSGMGVGSGH